MWNQRFWTVPNPPPAGPQPLPGRSRGDGAVPRYWFLSFLLRRKQRDFVHYMIHHNHVICNFESTDIQEAGCWEGDLGKGGCACLSLKKPLVGGICSISSLTPEFTLTWNVETLHFLVFAGWNEKMLLRQGVGDFLYWSCNCKMIKVFSQNKEFRWYCRTDPAWTTSTAAGPLGPIVSHTSSL